MCRPNHLKELTIKDVASAFFKLLDVNEQTTSLEVKNYLRRKGFYATQSDISPVIKMIARESEIEYECNGEFRRYYSQTPIEPNVFDHLLRHLSFN